MIIIENLTIEFSNRVVVKNINTVFNKGLHYILGRNGSGKTTLLKTIAGIIKPREGRITVFNKDVHKLPRSEAVKLVGYVWQNPYAGFIEATIADEISFTAKLVKSSLNYSIVEKLVPTNLLDRNPFTLSGGEAKRVSIASVLAIDQPVWLLDEPFEYLDSQGIEAVKNIINYGVERGKIIIIASSNTSFLNMFKPSTVNILFNNQVLSINNITLLSEIDFTKYNIPSKEMICGST